MTTLRPHQGLAETATHSTGELLNRVQVIPAADGLTELHIPPSCFWDCVDCLGDNRLEASFSFHPSYFIARIRRAPASRIHDALRNWGTPDSLECRCERLTDDDYLEG